MNLHCLLVTAMLFISSLCTAALHPRIMDPRISKCGNHSPLTCNWFVSYSSSGTDTIEISPLAPPVPSGGLELQTIGVHCENGSSLLGLPFTDCVYKDDRTHAPPATGCRLITSHGWDLDPNYTCSTETSWGGHQGAGPGGECVLFVQKGQWTPSSAFTIYGVLGATLVANSGSRFCQKPLPPSVDCNVNIPSELDHRTIAPTGSSTVTVSGTVECGMSPKVSIVGGGVLELAPGLTANISAQIDGPNTVNLTSKLHAVSAPAGEHRGSVVMLVSPY